MFFLEHDNITTLHSYHFKLDCQIRCARDFDLICKNMGNKSYFWWFTASLALMVPWKHQWSLYITKPFFIMEKYTLQMIQRFCTLQRCKRTIVCASIFQNVSMFCFKELLVVLWMFKVLPIKQIFFKRAKIMVILRNRSLRGFLGNPLYEIAVKTSFWRRYLCRIRNLSLYLYVTLEHKTSHKGQFCEIEMYA